MKLYGISNCDTVRKARKYLEAQGCDFEFIDFRKDGLESANILAWLQATDWPSILNKRSRGWRELDSAQQALLSEPQPSAAAITLLTERPTLIKRPVLETQNTVLFGFNPAQYQQNL